MLILSSVVDKPILCDVITTVSLFGRNFSRSKYYAYSDKVIFLYVLICAYLRQSLLDLIRIFE